jgi:hypothetical protein
MKQATIKAFTIIMKKSSYYLPSQGQIPPPFPNSFEDIPNRGDGVLLQPRPSGFAQPIGKGFGDEIPSPSAYISQQGQDSFTCPPPEIFNSIAYPIPESLPKALPVRSGFGCMLSSSKVQRICQRVRVVMTVYLKGICSQES